MRKVIKYSVLVTILSITTACQQAYSISKTKALGGQAFSPTGTSNEARKGGSDNLNNGGQQARPTPTPVVPIGGDDLTDQSCAPLFNAIDEKVVASNGHGYAYFSAVSSTGRVGALYYRTNGLQLTGFNLYSKYSSKEDYVANFCTANVSGVDCDAGHSDFIFSMNTSTGIVNIPGAGEISGCISGVSSPLIVDLGKGVSLSAPLETETFLDITGDGIENRISCVQEGAFVALPDSNGQVNNINELFGNNTVGPDGMKEKNGFLALAKHDDNNDELITSSDLVFEDLRLWKDENCDGQAQRNEFQELAEAGISMIDLGFVDMLEVDSFGNETRQRSTVELATGELRKIFDVWFMLSGTR